MQHKTELEVRLISYLFLSFISPTRMYGKAEYTQVLGALPKTCSIKPSRRLGFMQLPVIPVTTAFRRPIRFGRGIRRFRRRRGQLSEYRLSHLFVYSGK